MAFHFVWQQGYSPGDTLAQRHFKFSQNLFEIILDGKSRQKKKKVIRGKMLFLCSNMMTKYYRFILTHINIIMSRNFNAAVRIRDVHISLYIKKKYKHKLKTWLDKALIKLFYSRSITQK